VAEVKESFGAPCVITHVSAILCITAIICHLITLNHHTITSTIVNNKYVAALMSTANPKAGAASFLLAQ
jgi:hypothetical protein